MREGSKPRGRPALPAGEKTVTGSVRITPARWAKLRALGMGWLGDAIDRAEAPSPSLIDPMAPIADLLAKQGGEGLSGGEGQIIRAHFATIESELKELRAVTRELRAAAKRPRLTP